MQLHVYQSIWGMEQLPWKRPTPWSLEEQIERIAAAGFDGISVSFTDAARAKQICALATERDLRIQAAYFPTSVEELKPVFETIAEVGRAHVDHLNLQPNVRPFTVAECVPYLLGWHSRPAATTAAWPRPADERRARHYVQGRESHHDPRPPAPGRPPRPRRGRRPGQRPSASWC